MMEQKAGWTKEDPKVDGVYWWRADHTDFEPDIHSVVNGRFYEVGEQFSRVVENFGGEWFGPISPSDAEQLMELRKTGQNALEWIAVQAETWTCQHADEPLRCSRCSLRQKAQSLADQLRAVLNPKQPEKETQ